VASFAITFGVKSGVKTFSKRCKIVIIYSGFYPDVFRESCKHRCFVISLNLLEKGYIAVVAEYLDHGIDTVPAANGLRAGINRVGEYLRVDPERIHPLTGEKGSPRLFVFGSCENLIREFPRYRWRQLQSAEMGARNQPEEPLGVDDHALDALRYFLASRPGPLEKEKPEYLTLQQKARGHPDELAAQKVGVMDDHMGGII